MDKERTLERKKRKKGERRKEYDTKVKFQKTLCRILRVSALGMVSL